MKRILLVAVIALCGIAAQAQNKIFEKYAKMEGVEYVCINQAMFSAGLSIATGGQVVVDEANTQGTDLSKFANYNRMIIITAKGDKKQVLYNDIQKLAKESNIPYHRLWTIINQNRKITVGDYVAICKALFEPLDYFIPE